MVETIGEYAHLTARAERNTNCNAPCFEVKGTASRRHAVRSGHVIKPEEFFFVRSLSVVKVNGGNDEFVLANVTAEDPETGKLGWIRAAHIHTNNP